MRADLPDTPLIRFLRNPNTTGERLAPAEWELLLRQARRTNLLGRIAYQLIRDRNFHNLPDKVKLHLENANRLSQASTRSTLWEIRKIHEALAGANIPFMLLKGAAYACIDAPSSHGRMFADTDIMVMLDHLGESERVLKQHGWMPTRMDAYDQKYYRQWMHEIPPLQHFKRRTTIDVHHTILPPTARLKPNPVLLWEDAKRADDYPGIFVLSDIDMVLHSATHLFHDGDFVQGLRDIADIDALLRAQASSTNFWDNLPRRAEKLDLSRPLYYALHFCEKLLETPIPYEKLRLLERQAAILPSTVKFMDWLLQAAMFPSVDGNKSLVRDFSQWALYVRSHYLRMPLHLLLPHLLRKSLSVTH